MIEKIKLLIYKNVQNKSKVYFTVQSAI